MLTQPTAQPGDRAAWNSLCVATDFETGQLQGEVGTPEDPGFTYEEAIHNHRSGQAMTLHVGEDIVRQIGEELIHLSGPKLKQLTMDVEESRLPLLLQGMLPGGWDALGRPWALMDCPAEQVPQVSSVHDQPRVTVAVLVSFPPDPLYFPNRKHLECALRVWKKAKQRRPARLEEEAHPDGSLKSAGTTYRRLTWPGYRDSVPVQEALKETRWSDFCEGRWGNRENPRAPEGDVRPAPVPEAIPEREQPAATTSRSVLSHCSVSSSVSALTVSSRDTHTSGALQIVIPASGTKDSEEEMEVPAPPPRIAGPPDSSHDHLTEAVTTAVLHRQQMEDEAAASSSSGPEKKPQVRATRPDPRRPGCSELGEPTGSDPVETGTRKEQGTAMPVETHTWEEMEGAVGQGAHGTAEGTMGYALTILDRMRTDMQEQFRARTRALQAGRQESEEFGRNPKMQELMGRTRYLWEQNITLQLQVRTLTEEREDLVRRQATDLTTTLGLHDKVAELKRERDQLQQQLASLHAKSPMTTPAPPSEASEVRRVAKEWKTMADRLKADADRIRTERSQLQEQLKELRAAYQRQTADLLRANGTIDIFQEQIRLLRQAAPPASPAAQTLTTPTGSGLPMHQEMGGHIRRPLVSDSAVLLATTPEGHTMPPTLTPVRNHTPGPLGTGTPVLPRLTPQPSASLAAPPHQELDREETMDSEPQPGPESQH